MEIILDNAESGAGRPASILVVDDEAPIRELLTEILDGRGFHVREASNGKRAVQHIAENRESPVDLVIMDLAMPEKEGLETIREILRDFPEVKIIAISGYRSGDFLHHAALFGARATIKKPFSIDGVLKTVANVLAA